MNDLVRKIKSNPHHFKHIEFNEVSPECKDLISKLLEKNPTKRISGIQALNHPWFKMLEETKLEKTLSTQVV
jgi:serine/threonine protein kinase